MANITHKMTLSTTKDNYDVGVVKVRQTDDETQIFNVKIIENGKTKTFKGLTAFFCVLPRKIGVGVVEEKVIDATPCRGELRHTLTENSMLMAGKNQAYFSFRKQLGSGLWAEQFSTRSFYYTVEKSIYTVPFKDSNYWTTFNELYAKLQTFINSGKSSWNDFVTGNRAIIESIDPGGEILSEVVDARGAYTKLSERLQDYESKLAVMEEAENGFDIEKIEPVFLMEANGYRNAVNQSINIDIETHEMYVTQSDSQNPEGYWITRLTPTGDAISKMHVEQGGHGTDIGIERKSNGNLKIWSWSAVAGQVIHFDYVDNGKLTVSEQQNAIRYNIDRLEGMYTGISFDQYADNLVFRYRENNNEYETIEIHSRTNILNQIDNVISKTELKQSPTNDEIPMQGICVYGDWIFYQRGWSFSASETGICNAFIEQYSIKTGELLKRTTPKVVTEAGFDAFEGNYNEPEGLFFYVDPKNGAYTLGFVYTVGALGKRHHQVFGFMQRGAWQHWNSVTRVGGQNFKLTNGGGRSLFLEDNVTSLLDVRRAGYYYIQSSQAMLLNDLPVSKDKNVGWYLEVSPETNVGACRQTLYRNSQANRVQIYTRVITQSGLDSTEKAGLWSVIRTDAPTEEYLLPEDWDNQLANVIYAGDYYITTPQTAIFQDFPAAEKGLAGYDFTVTSGDFLGKVRQTLRRNTVDGYFYEFTRKVDVNSKEATDWFFTGRGKKVYRKDLASINPALQIANSPSIEIFDDGTNLTVRTDITFSTAPTGVINIGTITDVNTRPVRFWDVAVASGYESGVSTQLALCRFASTGEINLIIPANSLAKRWTINVLVPKY